MIIGLLACVCFQQHHDIAAVEEMIVDRLCFQTTERAQESWNCFGLRYINERHQDSPAITFKIPSIPKSKTLGVEILF